MNPMPIQSPSLLNVSPRSLAVAVAIDTQPCAVVGPIRHRGVPGGHAAPSHFRAT